MKKYFLTAALAMFTFIAGGIFVASSEAATPLSLVHRLAGRILLQVQSKGEAWYVDPVTLTRTYLGRPADCFDVMRVKGLGITNADLYNIPTDSSFSTMPQTLGEKGLEYALTGIRTADHEDYYRIVFDVENTDGTEAQILPYTEGNYAPSAPVVTVIITGIQKDLTGLAFESPVLLNNATVASYTKRDILDDKTIRYYEIALNTSSRYKIFSLLNPARVVVDIEK